MKPLFSVLLLGLALVGKIGQCDEPAEKFLDQLLANGYHDLAMVYLEQMEAGDLVDEEFRRRIPLEKARILIDGVRRANSIEEANGILDEADQLLQQYTATAGSADQKSNSFLISGNLFLKRGSLFERQLDSDRLVESERNELRERAREMYEKASRNFDAARSELVAILKDFKVDPGDPGSSNERERLRSRFTRVRLNQPVVTERLAETYAEDNPRRKQLLEQAATEYKDVMDDYRTYRAGLEACLAAAGCERKLGRPSEALFLLESLFELKLTDSTRELRRQALQLACLCWEEQETLPFQEVISVCESSINRLSRDEQRHPDWLKVQLTLAKAYRAKADFVLNRQDPPQQGAPAMARRLKRDAVVLVKRVSRVPGAMQGPARELLTAWNEELGELAQEEEEAPRTFLEARQKGQDLVADIEGLLMEVGRLEAAVPENEDAIADLENARERLASQTESALEMFSLALEMTTSDVEREEINRVRYYQSFCYFALGRYYDSAVIGEFLLKRYPTLDWTRQSAGLAVRSYAELLAGKEGPQPFESGRLASVADQLMEGWPGTPEASLAARLMAINALSNDDFERAALYIERIPREYELRGSLSANLGRAIWFNYLRKRDELSEGEGRLQVLEARRHLSEAVESADRDTLTYDLALASLLLVDANLELGETEEAMAQLETAELAPLDLVKARLQAIESSPNAALYRKETWKTAIRTYLAGLESGEGIQQLVDKTRGVLQALEAETAASDDPAEKSRLAAIYRMIASRLKSQFDRLESPQERRAFGQTIASFLTGIEQNASDAKTVLWAGSTLMEIADGFAREGLEEDARNFFEQAVPALDRAEQIGFGGEPNAEAYSNELKRQRALAQRGAGNYEAAFEQLVELLKESPNRLNIQLDAARTLQEWGRSTGDADKFAQAMMGTEKARDPKTRQQSNVVWGWRKIYTATRNRDEFLDQFYESLFYLIESRLEYGRLKPSQKAVQSAQVELQNARRRDASLGGAGWKNRFEELAQRIEQELGN